MGPDARCHDAERRPFYTWRSINIHVTDRVRH